MRYVFNYQLIDGMPHIYIYDTEAERNILEVLEVPYDTRKDEDRLNPEAWRPGPLAEFVIGAIQS
jgi:hypothetical protein